MYEEIPKGPLRHGAALVLALLLCTTAALAAEPVQRSLIPVGHTVGVKLFARGVVVVKLHVTLFPEVIRTNKVCIRLTKALRIIIQTHISENGRTV